MITQDQVENAQTNWGNGVVKIGSLKNDFQECESYTNFLEDLYNFQNGTVLFKPTKCANEQFRASKKKLYRTLWLEKIELVKKTRICYPTMDKGQI